MGVTVENGRYRARVSREGKRINLGSFDTELKATRALNKWKRENRTDPIQELYQPDLVIPRGEDFLGRPLEKKPTLRERVKNAFNRNRSSAGTEE